MSLFALPIPRDLVEIVIDFIHTPPPEQYKMVCYELLHYACCCSELSQEWTPPLPSDYKFFMHLTGESFEWQRTNFPMGAFRFIHYSRFFLCDPDMCRSHHSSAQFRELFDLDSFWVNTTTYLLPWASRCCFGIQNLRFRDRVCLKNVLWLLGPGQKMSGQKVSGCAWK